MWTNIVMSVHGIGAKRSTGVARRSAGDVKSARSANAAVAKSDTVNVNVKRSVVNAGARSGIAIITMNITAGMRRTGRLWLLLMNRCQNTFSLYKERVFCASTVGNEANFVSLE